MVNSGNGTMTKLLTDSVMASNLAQSLENIRKSTASFEQNMEAMKHSFFLKGYFKRQAKDSLKLQ